MVNVTPLLTLIKRAESTGAVTSQNVPNEYDVVWGGIRASHRPQAKVGKYLTAMTAAEVLGWQRDVVNWGSASSAAGAYQFIRATLEGLVAPDKRHLLLSPSFQDELAKVLLERRGLAKWTSFELTDEQFGDNIAKEWASFPVHRDQRGHSRDVKRGQSYYAGDGLNKAGLTPEEVLRVLKSINRTSVNPGPPVVGNNIEERLAILEEAVKSMREHLRSI